MGLLCSTASFAQFTASIQGMVEDPSGAGLPHATVDLVNAATGVTATTTADASGNYRFLSLAPGAYKVAAQATGFTKSQVDITLLTGQNLNVPVTLKVGSISETITVTTEAPVVDTADSRTHLTLENQEVAQLPVAGRNLVTLVTLAPGVSGLGTTGGGQPGGVGSPGSGVDNYSTETQVDANANGRGEMANMYVVDGREPRKALLSMEFSLRDNSPLLLSVRRAMKRRASSANLTLPRPTSTSTRTRVLRKESILNCGLNSSISSTGQTCPTSIPICRMEISAKRRDHNCPDGGNWEARFRSKPRQTDHNGGPASLEAGRPSLFEQGVQCPGVVPTEP